MLEAFDWLADKSQFRAQLAAFGVVVGLVGFFLLQSVRLFPFTVLVGN